MIIVELIGGLGNQLFQYANAMNLAKQLGRDVFFDLEFFNNDEFKKYYKLDKFNTKVIPAKIEDSRKIKKRTITPRIARRILRKLGSDGYYNKSNYFDESWFEANDSIELNKKMNIFVSGYFTDKKYFDNIKDQILEDFKLSVPLNESNITILNKIQNTNSVSVHIRRGDYVTNPFFTTVNLEYYHRAMKYMESLVENPKYFIFSDDMNWVKNNFSMMVNFEYVEINDMNTDFMELFLMSRCKHNIIANSTFSWWGAWLNPNTKKNVVAPYSWFEDEVSQANYENNYLVPIEWTKM
jgi:hypothetical protein